MMQKIETKLEGCFLIKPKTFEDPRGSLTKIFHRPSFLDLGLAVEFPEEYYSISTKGVVRGLHFQIPPDDHIKCITCLQGKIFDVVVDLRKKSPTYGENFTVTLESQNPMILYVPAGFAHGFMALEDNSLFLNKSTTIYSPSCDNGIKWNSCGIDWPDLIPVVSEKDKEMIDFKYFNSPF
jgi:dTDP-4-dehydrorhamnose 3,5-epimerase